MQTRLVAPVQLADHALGNERMVQPPEANTVSG
jgi:hypothetical protein